MTSQQKETWSVTVLRDHLSEAMMLVLRPRLDRKSSHWAWQVTLHTVYQSESTHKHCNKLCKTEWSCNCFLKIPIAMYSSHETF